MDIKSGLKSFRLRKNFNQEDLAKALDVNQQNISLWEAGRGYPSYAVLKKLLELGAKVEEIFGIEYAEMHLDSEIETRNKELIKIMNKDKELDKIISEWRDTKSKIESLDYLTSIVKQGQEKLESIERTIIVAELGNKIMEKPQKDDKEIKEG